VAAVSRASALPAVVALAFAGASPSAAEPAPAAPTRAGAWIARVVHPTPARERPRGRVVGRIAASAAWAGGPVGLLVLGSREDAAGRLWLRVRLPVRPNGASAWIRADDTKLSRTAYRVEVSVGRRTVRLLSRGRVIREYGAVVGAAAWPTPRGLFAVAERVLQPDADGFLGPWALLLTAYSPTLTSFGGGPGQVALHGRAGASLADPLGTARSHGCIRIPNVGVNLLARVAREGTPVVVS
jgi:hypothetical protein